MRLCLISHVTLYVTKVKGKTNNGLENYLRKFLINAMIENIKGRRWIHLLSSTPV